MKSHEYQARQLFEQYGIPVSKGVVVTDAAKAGEAFKAIGGATAIAKVQVQMGGRGKAGGVKKVSSADETRAFAEKFLGKPFSTFQSAGESKTVRSVLVTEDKTIREEYYLGITIDRSHRSPVILFSKSGGMDIEEVAAKDPHAILKFHFMPDRIPTAKELVAFFQGSFPTGDFAGQCADVTAKLAKLFVEKDAAICEINPLAWIDPNRIAALDAKIVFDDNALFRHPDVAALKDPEEDDERERKAKQIGLSYVSMSGNVGCLVNGAGLAMATMDMIKLAGGEPANFLDVGGSATTDMVREGVKIILHDERVKAIFVHIFGGIAKCDVIAEGVVLACREIKLEIPLIVRLEGTRVKEGREILKNSGLKIISCETIREAAEAAVREAKRMEGAHVHSR
jgi:succinyl-CoA synthetase beta subunit